MALIGFRKQFAPEVESGKKRQTIRANRRHPIRPGDTLYLYMGLRTSGARKLREAVCRSVETVRLFPLGASGLDISIGGGDPLLKSEAERFAREDGFSGEDPVCAMRFFFEKAHGLPFEGILVKW